MPAPGTGSDRLTAWAREHLATVLVGLGVFLHLCWPVLVSPFRALGNVTSEAIGHLWGLTVASEGLMAHGPFVRVTSDVGFPDGFRGDLMDPVNLVVFAPVHALTDQPVLAWNALHITWILLGILGAVSLARRLFPGRAWAPPLLIVACVASPFVLAHHHFGRSELLPALLLPLHLAWLHDSLVAPDPSRRSVVLAGLSMGAMALGGWYLAVFTLLCAVPIAMVWAWSTRRPWTLMAVGVIAILPVLPALVSLRAAGSSLVAARTSAFIPPAPAVGIPGIAPPLHSFRIPYPDLAMQGLEQPAYAGVALLAFGALAVVMGPGRRAAAGWLGLTAWLLVWAWGHDIVLWADPSGTVVTAIGGFPRLAHTLVPETAGILAWNRLGSIVCVPAGIAMLYGVDAVRRRWPGLVHGWPLLAAAIYLDQSTWPQQWSPGPATFEPSPPTELVEVSHALPPGALMLLPFDVYPPPPPSVRQRYVLWQRWIDRPITGSVAPFPEAMLGRSTLASFVLALQDRAAARRDNRRPAFVQHLRGLSDPDLADCIRSDLAGLHALGIAGVVLVEDDPMARALRPHLLRWLGPATEERGGITAWSLAGLRAPAVDCPYPVLERPAVVNVRGSSR